MHHYAFLKLYHFDPPTLITYDCMQGTVLKRNYTHCRAVWEVGQLYYCSCIELASYQQGQTEKKPGEQDVMTPTTHHYAKTIPVNQPILLSLFTASTHKHKILISLDSLHFQPLQLHLEPPVGPHRRPLPLHVVDRLKVANLHFLHHVGDDQSGTPGYAEGTVHQHALFLSQGLVYEPAHLVEIHADIFLGRVTHVDMAVAEVLGEVGLELGASHDDVGDPEVFQDLAMGGRAPVADVEVFGDFVHVQLGVRIRTHLKRGKIDYNA